MMPEKGWIVDDEFKELIDIFAMENHQVLAEMLSYAIELIQYEFDGEEGSIHVAVSHDPEDGMRTLTIHIRPAIYVESETDPITHDWIPGSFMGRINKIQNNVDRKFAPDGYSRSRLDVWFLVTTDFADAETRHTAEEKQ